MVTVYYMPEVMPRGAYARLVSDLLDTKPIQVGEWQAMDVSKSDLHKTHELEDVTLVWESLPHQLNQVMPFIDIAWANEHFDERVCGQPLNPAPSHERWPYAVGGNQRHMNAAETITSAPGTGYVFDHTYPERFWPVYAGEKGPAPEVPNSWPGHRGIRFEYGDLFDVADLLARSPLTRQAYLPIWFPEDTGATEGQRVPCTLGYHFMQRGGKLSMRYYLRSCDIYRHLSNDVYFAARLLDWMCDKVWELTENSRTPVHFRRGSLTMHISSLHAFVGDKSKINDRMGKNHEEALHDHL